MRDPGRPGASPRPEIPGFLLAFSGINDEKLHAAGVSGKALRIFINGLEVYMRIGIHNAFRTLAISNARRKAQEKKLLDDKKTSRTNPRP